MTSEAPMLAQLDLESLTKCLAYLAPRGALFVALAALSAVLTIAAGRLVIPWLVKRKINDGENRKASEYLAMLHGGKKNTPTMGGVFLVPAIMLVTLAAVGALCGLASPAMALAAIACLVLAANAALGLIDDFRKLMKLGKDGISGRTKLATQMLIALGACVAAVLVMGPDAMVARLPFATIALGWWVVPVGVFVIVGAGNAYNLTDGLDGLAGGTGAVTFFALAGVPALIALGEGGDALVVTSLAAVAAAGGLVGFLYWNRHPARVFMGDTGSLSLGALMGFIAVISGLELILAVAGAVFVVEALSVMLQVGYFKATHGKRIFRCAPLHHHFQFGGWHETKVTKHFIAAAIACAVLALALSATMVVKPVAESRMETVAQPREVPAGAVVEK